jgi:hypothetical protein
VLNRNNVIVAILLLVLLVQADVIRIPGQTVNVDRVTYVYEKDTTAIPRPVSFALVKLNEQGITATEFEVDTVTGTGNVPEQYVIAKRAGTDAGLPSLVVQSGEKVVTVVRDPKTEADVMKAVK